MQALRAQHSPKGKDRCEKPVGSLISDVFFAVTKFSQSNFSKRYLTSEVKPWPNELASRTKVTKLKTWVYLQLRLIWFFRCFVNLLANQIQP